MNQDKTAILRGMLRPEIATVDRHCTDDARLIHLGENRGWAIRGTLRNGAVVSATNRNLAGTGASTEFRLDLCADIDGAPVAFLDGGNGLEYQLAIADKLTVEQVAALREGNLPTHLPHDIQMLPHTVVTARSGDRIEISNQGQGREELVVCDPNGSHDGTYYGFTLPRTELVTMLGDLSSKLARRFGTPMTDAAEHHRRHTEQRQLRIGAAAGAVFATLAVLCGVLLMAGVVTLDNPQLAIASALLAIGIAAAGVVARDIAWHRRITAELRRDGYTHLDPAPKHARKPQPNRQD
jgi:hypothetical protein